MKLPMEESNQYWLKSILLTHGRPILDRYIPLYYRLNQLPRRVRRKIQLAAGTSLTALALLLALSGPPAVHAADIVVDGTTCTLADAITAANTDAMTGGCIAGDAGADTINIRANIDLTAVLPSITSAITIDGHGHTIQRTGGGNFRILHVTNAGNLTLNSVTITGGNLASAVASQYGGGILSEGTLLIRNSTITGNTINITSNGMYDYAAGGGIAGEGAAANITIQNSTISNNSVTSTALNTFGVGGGTSVRNGGTMLIENSTISGNTTTSGDEYGGGGGTFGSDSTLTLNHATVTGNTATTADIAMGNGGGVYTFTYNVPMILNIYNSIISGNNANAFADCWSNPPSTTTYSIIGQNNNCGGTAPTGSLNLDGTLNDHGGPTQLHALQAGSQAVDFIPTSDPSCTAGDPDQRGAARADGADAGAGCDAGAYEFRNAVQSCALSTGIDININGVIFNFSNLGTLNCVTVEGMGANHIEADDANLQTNNWWHITGDGTGFTADLTLPYATADADTRACKYPGGLGGFDWDCDNGTNTTFMANQSVTRSNVTSFSDWAVGQAVGPTAVEFNHTTSTAESTQTLPLLLTTVMLSLGTAWAALRRRFGRSV